jgi:hypothetical protein
LRPNQQLGRKRKRKRRRKEAGEGKEGSYRVESQECREK